MSILLCLTRTETEKWMYCKCIEKIKCEKQSICRRKKELIHLSTDDLKDIIREVLDEYYIPIATENLKIDAEINLEEPLQAFKGQYYKTLKEGLIQTYGLEKTKDIILRRFGLNDNQFKVQITNNDGLERRVPIIVLPKGVNNRIIGNIKNLMNTCGYSMTSKQYRRDLVLLVFEGKFGEDVTDIVRGRYKYLYHLTPQKHLEKILKIGLSPRSDNSVYKHPDRVYLMNGVLDDNLTDNQIEVFNNIINSKQDNNQYFVLKLSIDKIPDNVIFYADSLTDEGIFTYNNIPPNAIITYKQFQ